MSRTAFEVAAMYFIYASRQLATFALDIATFGPTDDDLVKLSELAKKVEARAEELKALEVSA